MSSFEERVQSKMTEINFAQKQAELIVKYSSITTRTIIQTISHLKIECNEHDSRRLYNRKSNSSIKSVSDNDLMDKKVLLNEYEEELNRRSTIDQYSVDAEVTKLNDEFFDEEKKARAILRKIEKEKADETSRR